MDLTLNLLVSAIGLAVVAQYTWALRGHFSSRSVPRGTMLISLVVVATTVVFLALTWLGTQPVWAVLLGVAIQLVGLALFWAAIRASRSARLRLAFDAEHPDSIVVEGPYRHLRHPFYTSYLIFWIGWAVATWSPWALVPLAVLLAVYITAALDEERKFSSTALAGEYEAYKQRAGFLWPRFR
jgi:protein-S-isoprenylcysteine O-methyltransferase Ste14